MTVGPGPSLDQRGEEKTKTEVHLGPKLQSVSHSSPYVLIMCLKAGVLQSAYCCSIHQ